MKEKLESSWFTLIVLVATAGLLTVVSCSEEGEVAEESSAETLEAQPGGEGERPGGRGRRGGRDAVEDKLRADFSGPSVLEGETPGIEVDQYAPDFQLEPVEVSPKFASWLGDRAPRSFEDKVMLSDLLGEQPVMLFFGSYT
jgi:hypothetical protein